MSIRLVKLFCLILCGRALLLEDATAETVVTGVGEGSFADVTTVVDMALGFHFSE